MNNRGRGRPPRRRGFDDDFSFDRAPPGDMPSSRPSAAPSWPSSAGFGPEHDATVKWFNPEKGFGFVALSDGSGDAFLHANTLNQAGHNAVSPGASLRVRIGQGQKGRQVSEVLSVDESTATPSAGRGASMGGGARPAVGGYGGSMGGGMGGGAPRRGAPTGPSVEMQGTVKWYNATKGFGFVAPLEGGKDVFVHASALQRAGVMQLAEGQTISMEVVQGAKGPEASSIRVD
ncbi:MAG: cold-shock protein [Rhodospirillales bacterium]